jgi:hypothetical protein
MIKKCTYWIIFLFTISCTSSKKIDVKNETSKGREISKNELLNDSLILECDFKNYNLKTCHGMKELHLPHVYQIIYFTLNQNCILKNMRFCLILSLTIINNGWILW